MPAGERPLLSACIITRDEERDLPDCLATLDFCDEIVVVDSGSVDDTVALAERAGARVVSNPWPGFAAQRNVALDHARGTWVLEIDADERVTDLLRGEIEAFVRAAPGDVDLAAMPRREVLVGHALGPSAKYPNYCHRLLRRGALRHDESRTVHEGLVPQGPVHPLAGELTHHFATSWRGAVADAWRYAALEAQQISSPRTARAIVLGVVVRPVAKLGYRLWIDGGWRDGAVGLAKITLDCAADSVVWSRHALRGRSPGTREGRAAMHYGSRRWPRGKPHVAVLAFGRGPTEAAARWAAIAGAAGQDIVVLTDRPDAALPARVRTLARARAVLAIRALGAEEQLRTLDAVVVVGRRARAVARVLPGTLAGLLPRGLPLMDPALLEERIVRARDASGA